MEPRPNDPDGELELALFEFRQYLLDTIPPLTVSDSVELLIGCKPEVMLGEIQAWISAQARLQGSVPLSDYVFHALKKVHLFGELQLIERPDLQRYLDKLVPLAVGLCPPEDREFLRTHLSKLGQEEAVSSRVDIARQGERAKGGEAARATARVDDEVAHSLKRFSVLAERIERQRSRGLPAASAEAQKQAYSQLVGMAAASSSSSEELEGKLEELQKLGFDQQPSNIFRALGEAMPPWEIALPAEMLADANSGLAPMKAMKKIAALAKDKEEGTKRVSEMMLAAIEQFNSGSLSPAASILELAVSVAAEKKLDPPTVSKIREEAQAAIDTEQLRKYTEHKPKHALLRKVLNFFPEFTAGGLLEALRMEPKPKRRRGILSLIEVHGAPARALTLERLDVAINGNPPETDTYYQRNLLYLLHRIPPRADASFDKELEHLTKWSARGINVHVAKEAMVALAAIKGEPAEKLVKTRLTEYEGMLLSGDVDPWTIEETQALLDRTLAALARFGTPNALRRVANHGMKTNPELGDTRARLLNLAGHDLSVDETSVVTPLLRAIRDELPGKVLGMMVPKRNQANPLLLVEALSGTQSEAVRELFGEIASKFPDQEFGRVAVKALAPRPAEKPVAETAASLAGDLQFFALPTLLQSLQESRSTGLLNLKARAGDSAGKVLFDLGRIRDAQAGALRGPLAVYQMLQKPVAGTFAFQNRPEIAAKEGAETTFHNVMALILEGLRRHDEFSQAQALVPDDMALKVGDAKPSAIPGVTDPLLVREVWIKASSGQPPGAWESQIAADSYSVRRLLAHWLEEGALQAL